MIDGKWDHRFIRLAKEISTWSKDPSTQIGAIVVNDSRRILATGYNGFPRGIEDSEERLNNRQEKYSKIIHAETNALLNALYNGVSVKDATVYVYGLPTCSDCTKLIIQSGIRRVVVSFDTSSISHWIDQWNQISKPMYKESGVSISEYQI